MAARGTVPATHDAICLDGVEQWMRRGPCGGLAVAQRQRARWWV